MSMGKGTLRHIVAVVATLIVHVAAWAQASPVGLWKTIDDDGATEKSLVRISENGDVLTGRIEKLLDPRIRSDAVCDKCSDERKGQPVQGLTILRNLRHSAHEPDWWEGGDVTDPKNGKVYKARVRTVEAGKKLQLRGYLGPFYRTQTWIRVE